MRPVAFNVRAQERMLPTTILFLLGATMIAAGAYGLWRAQSARGWLQVEARIVRASILEELAVARFPHFLYTPAIQFKYEVFGHRHEGDRLTIVPADFWTADVMQAKAFIAGYPQGMRTTVRVKPGAPSVSVLLANASARALSHYAAIALSGCLLIFTRIVVNSLHHAP